MPILGLDHVQLAAPSGSEPETRAFFGELLGMTEIEKPEPMRATGGVWYQAGAQQLHIGIQSEFVPTRKGHPGLVVGAKELDSYAERLTAAGYPVEWDDRFPGRRRFYTSDPFENRLELLSL